jgi:tetratricopeptide (TPR) repeat protein
LVEGAEAAAKKAITLDPEYAGGYAALAGAYSWSGKWAKAIELAKQGLALDPEEPGWPDPVERDDFVCNWPTSKAAIGNLAPVPRRGRERATATVIERPPSARMCKRCSLLAELPGPWRSRIISMAVAPPYLRVGAAHAAAA